MSDEDLPVISFVEDVPGLPGLARCVLVALDEDASVFALRSVVDPDLRLLVVAPGAFFPDYSTEVADEIVEVLELEGDDQPLVLLVVNPGRRPGRRHGQPGRTDPGQPAHPPRRTGPAGRRRPPPARPPPRHRLLTPTRLGLAVGSGFGRRLRSKRVRDGPENPDWTAKPGVDGQTKAGG